MTSPRLLSPGVAYVLAAFASIVIFFFIVTAVLLSRNAALTDSRLDAARELSQFRANIEKNIYLNANLVQGLAAAIATEPDIGQERFAALAKYLLEGRNQIRNIGGAPNLVISLMYPLQGNETAIGLDYTKNEDQRAAALAAKEAGRLVIAGPVNLVQGGQGFIARFPVFSAEGTARPGAFWGLISTVIDVQRLYAESGIADAQTRLDIAIRGQDGDIEKFFYGDPALLTKDPVRAIVTLPNGQWELLAIPKGGWPQVSRNENAIIIAYLLAGAFIVVPLIFVGRLLAERRGITLALIEAREKSDAANAAKSQFLAMMSHELRTPMTGIMGICDLLASESQSAEQANMTRMLRQSAQRLLELLNDILDFSKIEAGQMHIEKVDFDLSALLQEVRNLFAPAMAEKGIQFVVEGAGAEAEVLRGDPKRLRQVLVNFVGNALKFTEKGHVRVRHWREHGQDGRLLLKCAVADSGIGISGDMLHRVFQKFEQEDTSTSRRYGGTGLGLAICKQLVEAMGGEITVDSVKNKGSTFTFSIPVERGNGVKVLPVAAAATMLPHSQAGEATLNILVAEDNLTTQLIISEVLAKWGHRATIVSDGQQAVAKAAAEKFDVILMDMQMPLMDGDEAARRIRANGGSSSAAPIIAFTADAITENHQKYLDAGCNAVITKPIVWPVLARELKSIVATTH